MIREDSHVTEKARVFDFIDQVDNKIQTDEQMNAFRNSDVYKYNMSKKECEKGKEQCINHIIHKFYRNATPLSDEYKHAKFNDFCADIEKHCPNGLLFYFREAIRRGNCGPKCQKMVEEVERVVDDAYKDKLVHPENYNEEDLVFRMDPEMRTHMNLLSDDLNLDDVSDMVRRSVRETTASEVTRAKEEKERNRELEKELANDLSITSESAITNAMERKGFAVPKIFQPTLMQGILIGKSDAIGDTVTESYNYHALEDYGMEGEMNFPMYEAFTEGIRELTWLTMEEKVFHNRPRTLFETRKLADEYARGIRQ